MGGTLIPLSASGQPAPVVLAEVATKRYAPPGGSGGGPPLATMPPPFPIPAGQSLAWAFPSTIEQSGVMTGCPGIFCPSTGWATGVAATPTHLASGTLGYTQSRPLGNNVAALRWSNFNVLPVGLPAGAVIHGIYPVILASAVHDGAFQNITYGNGSAAFTDDNEGSGFTQPGSGPPDGGGSATFEETEWYDASIGTSVAAIAAYKIKALLNTSASTDGMTDLMSVFGVGFAIYYSGGTTPVGSPDTSADDALARGIFFWSEHRAKWPSVITGNIEQFLDWLAAPPVFRIYGSTQTDTATIVIQNISGNTVERDAMKAFVETELDGALVVARLWRGDAEQQLLRFIGNVSGVHVTETQVEISVEGSGNWSAITVPSYDIDPSCPLTFASKACASTSPTPCDQTYGTCSSINRFAGVLTGWIEETPDVQIAQPAPNVIFNPRRPF